MARSISYMNQLYFIRSLLYELKQRYGVKADYYKTSPAVIDVSLGTKTVNKTKYRINRAIFLPSDLQTKFIYDLAFIAANKNFTYGGFFDPEERTVIIDGVDLRIQPSSEDYIIVDHRRYEIEKIEELERKLGYLFTVKLVKGNVNGEIHTCIAKSGLRYNQILTETIV